MSESSPQEAELEAPPARAVQPPRANGLPKDGVSAGGVSALGTKEVARNGAHASVTNQEAKVKEVLSELLFMEANEIPTAKSFIDIGLDSIVAVEFVKRLNRELSLSLNVGVMLNYPSVEKLVGHLSELTRGKSLGLDARKEHSKVESETRSPPKAQTADLEKRMRESLSDLLFMSADDIDPDKELFELGLDSIVSIEWIKRLNQEFGTAVPVAKIMDYSTLAKLSQLFRRGTAQMADLSRAV
jgi:acyl carrier protein